SDPGPSGIHGQEPRARLSRESTTPRVEEQSATCPLAHEARPRAAQIRPCRALRVAADRNLSLLAALPDDTHEPALQIEVVHVQPGELRDAHARPVEDLEDRAIAETGRAGAVRRLDEAPDLIHAQGMRECARHPRTDDLARGVLRQDPFTDEVPMERPYGREDARYRRRPVRRLIGSVRGSRHRWDEGPDDDVVHLVGPHDP